MAAENQVLEFLADLAGLPPGPGGCFVSGGSIANLSALVVARDTAALRRGAAPPRPRIAVSEEAHSSVAKVVADPGRRALRRPGGRPPPHRGRAAGRARTSTTIPTTSSAWWPRRGRPTPGSSTTWPASPTVASERRLWFHVDAAYGGAGLFSPLVRDRYAGIERADSFVIDPHKWLYAPFDCAALVYRQPGPGQGGARPGGRRTST